MASIEYDLRYLREALERLEDYLLVDELFWNFTASPPSGEPPYPALTLGGVLFAQSRLKSMQLNSSPYAELHSASMRLEAIHTRWRTAWETKCLRELKSRLSQWGNYIEDFRGNPESHVDRYGYEVRFRLIIDLLAGYIPTIPNELQELLNSLDLIHRHLFQKGSFVWDEIYQAGFSEEKYWYLFGRLKVMENRNSSGSSL